MQFVKKCCSYRPYRLLRKRAVYDVTSSDEISSVLAWIYVCGCVWRHLCVKDTVLEKHDDENRW